jgi:hypothetical protein
MTLDAAKNIGRSIGNLYKEQDDIKQNISADDSDALFLLSSSETVKITGSFVATKYNYASNAFIIDHPINSQLDSSIYELDLGYSLHDMWLGLPFSGNANNTASSGLVTTVVDAVLTTDKDGVSNSAYAFDGISSRVQYDDASTFTSYSFSCWAYLSPTATFSNASSNQVLFSGDTAFMINAFNSSRQMQVYAQSAWRTLGSYVFNTSTWYHIARVTTPTSALLYVNSVCVGSNTNTQYTYNEGRFSIGCRLDAATSAYSFAGKIDSFYLFDRAISETEISLLYNGGEILDYPFGVELYSTTF